MFAGATAPAGWAFCNGQILAIASNTQLFGVLGTTYGGNGTTTFALPDLRGRIPIHQGNGFILAETGGAEEITLTVSVISSAPPVSARMKLFPWWIGIRPRRSGKANVDSPSPP